MPAAIYSILHFFVDFVCAYSMYWKIHGGFWAYESILIYNFCAFALQMPLGTLLDAKSTTSSPKYFAAAGLFCTALGSTLHPALLGLGNALFHVGGGVDVIREDTARGWKGRSLGVFVAPGALGLFLGSQLANISDYTLYLAAALLLGMIPLLLHTGAPLPSNNYIGNPAVIPMLCCFGVVVLRSYLGMAVVFSWKQGFIMGLLAVCATVLGKAAGGFAACQFGTRNTVIFSLVLAAGCYLGSEAPFFGIAALFFFNMSMPITLYQLWRRLPRWPGLAFGVLTFALFLGFLPVYFGWKIIQNGSVFGIVGSLVSLVLLIPVCLEDLQ